MNRVSFEVDDGDVTIGHLIRRVRRRRGLSQYRLAAALVAVSGNPSLTRAHVSRWECGGCIPRPYWRSWLALVLRLPQRRLDHAATSPGRNQPMVDEQIATQIPEAVTDQVPLGVSAWSSQ